MSRKIIREPKTCAYEKCRRGPGCTRMVFTPKWNYDRTRYCSKVCGALDVPRWERARRGQKGGMSNAARRRKDTLDRHRARVLTMTPWEAFLAGIIHAEKRVHCRNYHAAIAEARAQGRDEGFILGRRSCGVDD